MAGYMLQGTSCMSDSDAFSYHILPTQRIPPGKMENASKLQGDRRAKLGTGVGEGIDQLQGMMVAGCSSSNGYLAAVWSPGTIQICHLWQRQKWFNVSMTGIWQVRQPQYLGAIGKFCFTRNPRVYRQLWKAAVYTTLPKASPSSGHCCM